MTVSHGDFYWNEVGLYQGLNNRLKYRIMIDGVDIRQLGLEDLRSHITIILQEPLLFSGIVCNLDPFNEYSEEFHLVSSGSSKYANCDLRSSYWIGYTCRRTWKQLFGGLAQLMCIARALLRKSKVILMEPLPPTIERPQILLIISIHFYCSQIR